MLRYISLFENIGIENTEEVGGKGANLGELVRAGFTVPPGFCIRAEAYAQFIGEYKLKEKILNILVSMDYDDIKDVEEKTASIREMITSSTIPYDITEEILKNYQELGAGKEMKPLVAVRSSAAVKGISVSSFPGQMDTYHNITGEEEILSAVKRCWASIWTARATINRHARGTDHSAVLIAPVIQKMIHPEVAGVMFTANPVTFEEDEIIIECSWGLGEVIVSGLIQPDRYLINKTTLEIKERQIGQKTKKIVYNEKEGYGSIMVDVPQDKVDQPTLSDDLIKQLVKMGKDIEAHYHKPQDIEWAYTNGTFFLLQSRPIASLKRGAPIGDEMNLIWDEKRYEKKPGDESIVWTRVFSDALWAYPTTPLFYSIQGEHITYFYDYVYKARGYKELLDLKIMRWHKTRVYFSTQWIKESLKYEPKSLREGMLNFFPPSQQKEIKSLPFKLSKRILGELRLLILYRDLLLTKNYKRWYEILPRWLNTIKEEFGAIDLQKASLEELHSAYTTLLELFFELCRTGGAGVLIWTNYLNQILMKTLNKWCNDDKGVLFSQLVSGLAMNKTTEQNLAIWELSKEIRGNNELAFIFQKNESTKILDELGRSVIGKDFIDKFNKFLAMYAHRGSAEREIFEPRWEEKPELVINILKSFITADDSLNPYEIEKYLKERREKVTKEVLNELSRQKWGFFKRKVFKFLLKWTQIYTAPFRDNIRFYADYVFVGQRKVFLAYGDRLVEKGILSERDDIFFLLKEEVFAAVEGKLEKEIIEDRINSRKEEYFKYCNTIPPMFLQGNREFEAEPSKEESEEVSFDKDLLAGVAASPGVITAKARIVHNLSEIHKVKNGEILVTHTTDPGWTAVFILVRGLVMESGGILSHGTVISREYGIPAVTNVDKATQIIEDGQTITVDGNKGLVTLRRDEGKVSV